MTSFTHGCRRRTHCQLPLRIGKRAGCVHAVVLTQLGMPCTVATGVTTSAILLPSQDYRIGGQVITSRFMIILAAMILWGICEGYGCETVVLRTSYPLRGYGPAGDMLRHDGRGLS